MQQGEYIWNRLRAAGLPVVLYGMGDGADKILALCGHYGVPVAAVFASNEFVRGQCFRGYRVQTLAEVEAAYPRFLILLCFASQRPEVLEHIRGIAGRHTLLAPDVPVCGDVIVTPELLLARQAEIGRAEALLADEQSRSVFREVLHYKLTGEPEALWRCETPRSEVFERVLPLGQTESFVDAGAYTGDTVEEFLHHTGGYYDRILALEPDRRNYAKLTATVERLGLLRVECLQTGAWSGPARLPFAHRSGRQAALGQGAGANTKDTPVDSIDNLLAGAPATYIKYDVEGAEAEALTGTAETIRRYRPKLAVAAYHRGDDLFTLPLLLHRLCPDYRLFLRHHPYLPAWETNLYATV